MRFRILVLVLLGICAATAVAAGSWPWRRRFNKHVETFHITAHKNTPVALWPAEPDAPTDIDEKEFERALGQLCRDASAVRVERYAGWILEDAGQWGVDPFLLAALVYDQSNCRPVTLKRYADRGLYGLTHLPLQMHARQTKKDLYTYYLKGEQGFEKRELTLPVILNRYKASAARTNLQLSAAILSVFKAQREMLVQEFPGHENRHYISNWFFGDRVRNPEPENRVLAARRRLLDYYAHKQDPSFGSFKTVPLVPPMDGSPRLLLDYFGNKRGQTNGYGHRGIDIDGAIGEPVRAIADGRVTFAGMDLPGGLNNKRLTVSQMEGTEASEIPQGGGFYVSILHGDGLATMYMHLHSFTVNYNQQVKAGEIIGTLGQSGAMKSGPHLHLEMLDGEHRVDPAGYLDPILVNPHK